MITNQNKTFHLDDEILRWTNNDLDSFTLRDAVRGVFVTGAIGSGKSSGIGDFVAHKYITAGFGGIVLCAKVGEADEWRIRAKLAGAEDRFVFFSKDDIYRFNPLMYEMSRTDEGGKSTEAMVDLFMRLSRLGSRMRGGSGSGSKDPFWDLVLERLVKAMLDILKLSGEPLTVNNMVRLLRAMLQEAGYNKFEIYCLEKDLLLENMASLKEQNDTLSQAEIIEQAEQDIQSQFFKTWDKNYLISCLYKIERTDLNEDDALTYDVAKQVFLYDFPSMDEKLKGSINETFYAFANPFRSGLLAKYMGASYITPEIMPECTFEGKIIVLDFPIHQYGILGAFAQVLYKKLWQDAVQRRAITPKTVPVFQFIDECQFFLDEGDMLFATTARSSKACLCLLTQSTSNLYAMIGNKDKVHSLLGNLTTKCFHNNDSYINNEWSSKTISNTKVSKSHGSMQGVQMASVSELYERQVQPQDFLSLKNGGEINDFLVEGYLTRLGGRPFSTGANFMKVRFKQRPKAQ